MTEDTDSNWVTSLAETGLTCPVSGESIAYVEGVLAITVVVAAQTHDGRLQPQLAVTDEKDDLLYTPQFIPSSAWEDTFEELEEARSSAGSIKDPYGICDCGVCKSSIRSGEVILLAAFGEIHRSKRTPNGTDGLNTFEMLDNNPTIICTACENVLHGKILQLWEEPVKQSNECAHGTQSRCWRHGCQAHKDRCMLLQNRYALPVIQGQ
jgi:hypothetical protein